MKINSMKNKRNPYFRKEFHVSKLYNGNNQLKLILA